MQSYSKMWKIDSWLQNCILNQIVVSENQLYPEEKEF